MLIRALVLFLVLCTGCRSGFIPCPEVKGLRLKKSQVNKRMRFDRNFQRDAPEPVITVSSEARTPSKRQKYRYVEYTMEHVDVEELDCPKPGDKKMPRAIRENIRKNRKKIRYYYQEARTDSLDLLHATYPQR